jgi:hypothetical protein
MTEENEIAAKFYSYGGEDETINLDTYFNQGVTVTVRIDDER